MKGTGGATENAITMERFRKTYGTQVAVESLSLAVPRGCIFGLLGPNGAGKTTTLRALLNLIQPDQGEVRVLGLDPRADGPALLEQVGYVPESPDLYSWMTVAEIVRFTAPFYRRWDHGLAARLMDRLQLPAAGRCGSLSRGTRAKVALLLALAARPELLILDDPTSGLDPITRREFLAESIANVQAEGGTVLFSSHLLHELERIADTVAIMDRGKLRVTGSLERIKSEYKQLRAVYPEAAPAGVALDGLVRSRREGRQATFTVARFAPALVAELKERGARSVEVIDLPLEEIYVEIIKGGANHA